MPLRDDVKIISVDDHLIEHPNVWRDRLPERYRDVGPRVVETTNETTNDFGDVIQAGAEVWAYEDRLYPQIATNAVAGSDPETWGNEPYRFDQIRPGCYDPKARLEDMDIDGVWAELCFPTFPGFSGTRFLASRDKELGLLCIRAYNDFLIDEWCGFAPDRQIPMVLLPLWDVDACVAEIERTAAKGARAVAFPENPVPLRLPSWHTGHWDRVFAAAQDAQLPMCMHFGTSGRVPIPSPESSLATTYTLMPGNSASCMADVLFSHVLHDFPELKIVLAEGGIGWIPALLERADYVWNRHWAYTNINREVRPSELYRDRIYGCFIDDEVGIRLRDLVGVDQILVEVDYPHSDSMWPNSRKHLTELLRDVPDDEAVKIAHGNASRLFRF